MPKQQTRASFWMRLHKNRLKIVTITFLIIAPIILVTALYIGSYVGSGRVHFDETKTEDTEMVSEFLALDGLTPFTLSIEWLELKLPTENADGALEGGYYRFSVAYDLKETYNISNVSVTPVLQTRWANIRSLGRNTQIAEVGRVVDVPFNHVMPATPLPFVTVDEPTLYLKVQYTQTSVGGTSIEHTEYVVFSLEGLNPGIVLD
jgi:hypothetical protein